MFITLAFHVNKKMYHRISSCIFFHKKNIRIRNRFYNKNVCFLSLLEIQLFICDICVFIVVTEMPIQTFLLIKMSVLVSMNILWIKSHISSARKVRILAMHESSNILSYTLLVKESIMIFDSTFFIRYEIDSNMMSINTFQV